MDGIVFKLTGKEEVFDEKEFCRRIDGLTYVGRFAHKKTSRVIQGTIIQYDGKFYTNELPGVSGFCSSPADENGIITTSLTLFETTEYVPEECKPVSECLIYINIWDTDVDDEGPIGSYAFYDDQQETAKEIVKSNKDVDIFRKGMKITREDFLKC